LPIVPDSTLDIALLYPELLGTYGDRGNGLVLQRRCTLRGIDARLLEIAVGDSVPATASIYLLGGGEDAPQLTALDALRSSGALSVGIDAGAVLLAVCAGFQIVGRELADAAGARIEGLGLLDVSTTRAPKRLVGELSVHDDVLDTGVLVGFENHRGVTTPGSDARPLGRRKPERGYATDGAVHDRIVGTYLHGPVLARNPRLADRLLEWVTGPLAPLCDREADALHDERVRALKRTRRWFARRR
jgi:lipid II isoglutaminyl synthase (glutamine-hydrolysing)